ncbi:RNA-binding transcriptional accessory protein [Acidaminobacter sp. JC074]|uniref:Tex family protein n=1 Tax=Acidaminobacter sp. JC074 TaxID=2530199 RepID=UPI001F0D2E3B|nr:Tex family protein [Acidaminobacter sp. JC074]MCH4889273.1 RNA-binding transcriptional accessory protein [Acidaminobacter sp. JC074]
MGKIIKILAGELKIKERQVSETIKLLDEGNTVPFIARYRKEMTGGLSDEILRDLFDRLTYLRNLEDRKEEVLRLIDEQGKLTEDLKAEILAADVLRRVEDLYRPYKQKKQTRASKAKAKGLEPLAMLIWNQETLEGDLITLSMDYINEELGVKTPKDAITGAMDIIAEMISDNPAHREVIRNMNLNTGFLTMTATDDKAESVYEMYYDYKESVKTIANHRILATNRGEKEKFIKVKLQSPDEQIVDYLKSETIKNVNALGNHELNVAIEDAYKRLISPSIEREVRSMLTERAEEEAIKVFAKNTKPLLLVPPVRDVIIMAIDPSYRTGCKLTVLDATGKLLDYATIYPNEPRNEIEKSKKVMKQMIKKYKVDVIPIGNGTASRETEQLVANMLAEMEEQVYYTIVSEAGASVYSASKLATQEYPDLDVSIRGAISIGRRLQDPLAELVKIDTKHIGVGQYQHDLNQKKLDESLTNVVEDCVNSVGIDLNIASPSLLQYVSGISSAVAKNIVAYRDENGKFHSRAELKKVKRLGDKVYEQCAGFLRLHESDNILDNTSVHPESYDQTFKLIEILGYDLSAIDVNNINDAFKNIDEKILAYKIPEVPKKKEKQKFSSNQKSLHGLSALKSLKFEEPKKKNKGKERLKDIERHLKGIAGDLDIGYFTLKDIVEELKKPGRDIRDEMPKPIFRSDVLKLEDLRVDMVLPGTVRNVVDFGAFVDIGVKQDGLVHISHLSDKFVKRPMDVVSVGDQVKVRVIDVDLDKQKIALSMKGIKE